MRRKQKPEGKCQAPKGRKRQRAESPEKASESQAEENREQREARRGITEIPRGGIPAERKGYFPAGLLPAGVSVRAARPESRPAASRERPRCRAVAPATPLASFEIPNCSGDEALVHGQRGHEAQYHDGDGHRPSGTSRKFVVSRTPITWFDAPNWRPCRSLGFRTSTARMTRTLAMRIRGNANRV